MAPLVSVIVPLYKTERYVEKCLRSIQRQTFEDFEVLCVDDGSPDSSAAIALSIGQFDKRFRVLTHEQNRGSGAARNTGIRAATGRYLAGVDSDDHLESDFLSRLVKGTDGGRFDVVCCGYARVNEVGEVLSTHLQQVGELDPIPRPFDPFEAVNPTFWNKLWLRSLYVDNDIYFPERENYQDLATTPRILMRARALRLIGGLSYNYLARQGSITLGASDKHLMDYLRVFDVLKEDLVATGDYAQMGPAFQRAVRAAIRFHLRNVRAHPDFNEDTELHQYARHLEIIGLSYELFDDRLRAGSSTKTLRRAAARALDPRPSATKKRGMSSLLQLLRAARKKVSSA